MTPQPDPGEAAPNPRRAFASPQELLDSDDLDLDAKRALLREWECDLDNRLKAEEEGMSASDPMAAKMEARLAQEVTDVRMALAALD